MKSEVKLSNVTKSFRKERVLRGITHSFEQGKIHGIMGFNGSGKTVMFKCICGFLRPDSGAVIVQGRRIGKDGDFPQSLGMIIESPGFLPHISGFANLKRLAAIRNRVTDEQIGRAWPGWGWIRSQRRRRVSIPSGCGSGWGSPRRSWKTPGCLCSMSLSTDWTSGAHRMYAICWMNCAAEGGRS